MGWRGLSPQMLQIAPKHEWPSPRNMTPVIRFTAHSNGRIIWKHLLSQSVSLSVRFIGWIFVKFLEEEGPILLHKMGRYRG